MSHSTNSVAASDADTINPNSIDAATERLVTLRSTSERNLPALIEKFGASDEGRSMLMAFLQERCDRQNSDQNKPEIDLVAGKLYQILFAAESPVCTDFLQAHFPTGIVPLRSHANIDYQPLQILLAKQDFQAADQLTLQKLCELAGNSAVQRKWIYFTEVEQLSLVDLQTIDALWQVHSEGRFGFSVQREVWLSVGKNWDKLWSKIGWRDGINWTRYPQGFIWNLSAPKGHLPLSNQLRGVRVIASLLAHPAWEHDR